MNGLFVLCFRYVKLQLTPYEVIPHWTHRSFTESKSLALTELIIIGIFQYNLYLVLCAIVRTAE